METGTVDAGIVYSTDARSSSKVKVAAWAPGNSYAPVIYPVAVMKRTKNPNVAKQFEAFVSSPAARSVFQKYGFRLVSR